MKRKPAKKKAARSRLKRVLNSVANDPSVVCEFVVKDPPPFREAGIFHVVGAPRSLTDDAENFILTKFSKHPPLRVCCVI